MTEFNIATFRDAEKTLADRNLQQALYDAGAVFMDRVLVTLHGEEHRTRRTLEMQVFRADFFRYYERGVFPRILDETLSPYLERGRADIVDFGYRVMINLTAEFAGIDRPERMEEETATLVRLLRTFGMGATLQHSTLDPEEVKVEVRKALTEFEERFFKPSVDRRRKLIAQLEAGEISNDDVGRDILTVLLQNEDKVELAWELLMRETAFFYLAGAHTSIHTLGHAMHEVLIWIDKHPEDRQKLQDDLVFLQACVHESIRLHPASPVAMRKPAGDVTLPSGDHPQADDRVVISLGEANRDAEIFGATAGEFNPHRDLPKGVQPYGLSFGNGMHACLGRNLAAGQISPDGKIADDHNFGTVTLIVNTLLKHGARQDPSDPPQKDTKTARDTWGYYPVLLGPA